MRKPGWLKTRLPSGQEFEQLGRRLQKYGLNTVCSAARCPNLAECWERGTATFMILGSTCTRNCRFCSVPTGNPRGVLDREEPERVALAVAELGLRYVVLTSVDRDDLADLGAGAFARTLHAIRNKPCAGADPGLSSASLDAEEADEIGGGPVQSGVKREASSVEPPRVEVLTPDFGARKELIRQVVEAGPDVFGHNIETVQRLSDGVRDPRASFRRSLSVLETAKRLAPQMKTKSGLMVGLGETDDEIVDTLRNLRSVGCNIVTIGQYLQPDRRCLPVQRYVAPEQFARYESRALEMGFTRAFCGPLVRSSYRAAEVFSN